MKTKLLNRGPERTYAVVLAPDDEPVECLTAFAQGEKLDCAHFTAIGAFSDAVLGYFNPEKKDYEELRVSGQTEVLSLVGNIALGPHGTPMLHAHAVLGRRDGSALGDHLMRASVSPTLEIVLVESPSWLRRSIDPRTGLALLDLRA